MVWQWPKTSTMAQQDQYYIWLGHFVEDLSYKNLPEQRWTCSCSSCTKSYQSAITIWQRTNYSTQLLLISCQHYTALWIEMKRAAGFWRSFYVMSDVLIGELDELDLTLVASTSQSYNLPDAMTLRYSRWWSLNLKNLNSLWMARKSMASSSVSTIRWMKWRTRSITAWWPQIFFWKYEYRHLNWIY